MVGRGQKYVLKFAAAPLGYREWHSVHDRPGTLLLCKPFANSTTLIDLPKWPDSEVCWTWNRSARQSRGTETAGARVGGYDLSGMRNCILETRLSLDYLH